MTLLKMLAAERWCRQREHERALLAHRDPWPKGSLTFSLPAPAFPIPAAPRDPSDIFSFMATEKSRACLICMSGRRPPGTSAGPVEIIAFYVQGADALQAAAKGLEIAMKQQQYSPGLVLDGLHTKTGLKPAAIVELWLTSVGLSKVAPAAGRPCWQGSAVAWIMDMTMEAPASAARLGYVLRAADRHAPVANGLVELCTSLHAIFVMPSAARHLQAQDMHNSTHTRLQAPTTKLHAP